MLGVDPFGIHPNIYYRTGFVYSLSRESLQLSRLFPAPALDKSGILRLTEKKAIARC